jgi:hypothetical protein
MVFLKFEIHGPTSRRSCAVGSGWTLIYVLESRPIAPALLPEV